MYRLQNQFTHCKRRSHAYLKSLTFSVRCAAALKVQSVPPVVGRTFMSPMISFTHFVLSSLDVHNSSYQWEKKLILAIAVMAGVNGNTGSRCEEGSGTIADPHLRIYLICSAFPKRCHGIIDWYSAPRWGFADPQSACSFAVRCKTNSTLSSSITTLNKVIPHMWAGDRWSPVIPRNTPVIAGGTRVAACQRHLL